MTLVRSCVRYSVYQPVLPSVFREGGGGDERGVGRARELSNFQCRVGNSKAKAYYACSRCNRACFGYFFLT